MPPLNYELLLIRTDILDLIKYTAKMIKGHSSQLPFHPPDWKFVWAINDEMRFLKKLTWIYRHNGGKLNADSNQKCSCDHAYQDKTYGPKLRVHNLCKPTGGKFLGATCTVCAHVELFKDGGKNVSKGI